MTAASLTTADLMNLACWVYERNDLVAYRITGPETRDFLHRMSTNHVREDGPGTGCLNVFPDRKGRMVAVVHQSTLSDTEVFLLAAESAPLGEWLDQFLFMEEIEVSKEPEAFSIFELGGPGLNVVTEKTFGDVLSLAKWAAKNLKDAICFRSFDGACLDTQTTPSLLVWSKESREQRLASLQSAGATPISKPDYEALRILAGIPAAAHEITPAYNPLELGLHDAIHWEKGCYIGQEVIARIDNYDKQSRRLVGLLSSQKVWEKMNKGAEIFAHGKSVGRITSTSPIFTEGQNCALAVVKISALSGGELCLGESDIETCRLK